MEKPCLAEGEWDGAGTHRKTMIRRLSDLVAPLSEREFLDCFSRKRRLVVKTTKPERTASLLPWATINRLASTRILGR